jgi:hypothetical protein
MHVGGFCCSVLKPNARVSLVQRAVVSSLIRFLPVILMIVKEASSTGLLLAGAVGCTDWSILDAYGDDRTN